MNGLEGQKWNSTQTCEVCQSNKIQKQSSILGKFAIYGLWWCGIGFLINRLSQQVFCEECHFINFMKKVRTRRVLELLMDDQSQYEAPPIDKDALEKKFDKNLFIGNKV